MQQNYYVKDSSSDYFNSYPSFGAGLGIYLYQRVYKWFGIQIGAEISAITTHYSGDKIFPDLAHRIGMTAYGTFTFPVLFNASYYFNGRHGLDISLGITPFTPFPGENMGIGVSVTECSFDGVCNDKGYYRFTLKHDIPSNISLYGKIGYNFLFKNKNILGVAIVGIYSGQPYAKGDYSVVLNDINGNEIEVESGYTSIRNTFIGLQFPYGFTMKKTLCMECKTTKE
jgi:hypothetical protein